MSGQPALVGVVLGCLLGCGASARPAGLAEGLCAEAAETFDGQVVAAYAMTVADVRATLPGSTQGWLGLAADAPAAKCYLDAAISKAPPPALDGTGSEHFDRALVFAAAGVPPTLSAAGYRDTLLPAPPGRP